jgi:membrane-bound lytic murein transglycosylase D
MGFRVKLQLFLIFFPFAFQAFVASGSGNPINHKGGGFAATKTCYVVESLDRLNRLNLFPDSLVGTIPLGKHPQFPDLVYEYKIAAIDNLSPIDFDFNEHVKRYIEIYTIERREQVSQMLGLSNLYFPLFDEMLDKHKLPLELKYLAVVESALNPLAVSSSGAVGLWQFLINSARMFDLEVNSYVDERMDPLKSTEAACMYLKYLHRIFNDWHLVMAAYNAGPGVVRNAITRSGGETNFWKLYNHLPEAAQNYVPAFIAAAYVMQNAKDHEIYPIPPVVSFFQTDTIHLQEPASLAVISREIGVPEDVIQFLNPTYRVGFVPKMENGSVIRIPAVKVDAFLKKEKTIYEKTNLKDDYHDVLANSGNTTGRVMVVHRVQSGDYLHKIAIKYGCTVDDINVWNPNLGSELAIGQSITVWVDLQTFSRLQQENAGGLMN